MGRIITSYTAVQAAVAIPAVAAANAPICQWMPAQVAALRGTYMGLTRVRITLASAVQGSFGLIAAASAGVPAPGATHGQIASTSNGGYSSGAGGPSGLVSSWTTAPTFAATPHYFELGLAPGAIGNVIEWNWPEDDPLTANMQQEPGFFNSGLILHNLNAGPSPAIMVSARWLSFSSVP
jgi:hypothetical protein